MLLVGGVLGDVQEQRRCAGHGGGVGVNLVKRPGLGQGIGLVGGRFPGEDRVAVLQHGGILGLLHAEPAEVAAAHLRAGKGGLAGGIEVLGRDLRAVEIHVFHNAAAVLDGDVLEGKGLVAHGAILQRDGALGGVTLGLAEQDVVIEQVRPGVAGRVVIGVGVIRQDVGEGLALLQGDGALIQRLLVLAQLPDLQGGGAVGLMLGGCHQLQHAVVIQVGHSVAPFPGAVLLQGGQGVVQRLDPGVGRLLHGLLGGERIGVRRLGRNGFGFGIRGGGLPLFCSLGSNLAAGGKGEDHRKNQQKAKNRASFHLFPPASQALPALAGACAQFVFMEQPGKRA